jgi:hypothetical protein
LQFPGSTEQELRLRRLSLKDKISDIVTFEYSEEGVYVSMYESFSELNVEGPDEAGIITIYLQLVPACTRVGLEAHRQLTDIWQVNCQGRETPGR